MQGVADSDTSCQTVRFALLCATYKAEAGQRKQQLNVRSEVNYGVKAPFYVLQLPTLESPKLESTL